MEHKRFCRHQYVGHPPEKDCMTDYLKRKRKCTKTRKRKKQKTKSLKKQRRKKKVLTDRKTAIRKLDELKQFLSKKKQASFQKQPS